MVFDKTSLFDYYNKLAPNECNESHEVYLCEPEYTVRAAAYRSVIVW
jgi:hypothetical protein